jgi:competence protein ComEC
MQRFFGYARQSWLIMVALGLFLIGLVSVRLRLEPYVVIGVILGLFLLGLFMLRGRKHGFLFAIIITCAFGVGYWRGGIYLAKVDSYQRLFGKNVTMYATATQDAVYSERRQLVFTASNIVINNQEMVGNIEIEGFGVPMVYRGDRVGATGKLFSKRGENIAGIKFANLSIISADESIVNKFRREFAVGLQNVLPEPLASFGLGLLIGQRSSLPEDLNEQLVAVGLIHIVAVSGYNLTVLTNISKRSLQRRSRYQALFGSITLITLFLLVTGFSPSIVRAAVVSGLSLVTWYFGRSMKPVMILLLSAVLTAGINPLYVWSSIGWYLSFTAFFGVLVLAPLLRDRYLPVKVREKMLPQVLSETFAAQICTLPIILFIFGRLSIISVIANLLVVPIVPFAMISSLVAGLYGMIGPIFLGGFLVLPARVILEYIVSVTGVLASIPGISVMASISAFQMSILYCLIIAVALVLAIRVNRMRQPRASQF